MNVPDKCRRRVLQSIVTGSTLAAGCLDTSEETVSEPSETRTAVPGDGETPIQGESVPDDARYGARTMSENAGASAAYTHSPHAYYDAEADVTYTVYQNDDNNDPAIVAYDHETGLFTQSVAGTNPLGKTDGHGAPTITVDAEGYLHVFFGSHGNPIEHSRSVEPHDIGQWEQRSLSSVPSATYTSTTTLDSDVYVFYRQGDPDLVEGSGNVHEIGTLIKSTDGGDTWSAYPVVNQSTGGARHDDVYAQNLHAYDGKLYFTWVTAHGDDHGSNRIDPSMAYFDPETEHVYTVDGEDLGETITWQQRESCFAYEEGSLEDGVTFVANPYIDAERDVAYLAIQFDRGYTGDDLEYKLSRYENLSSGEGSWSTVDVDGIRGNVYNNFTFPRVNDDGEVEVHTSARPAEEDADLKYTVSTQNGDEWEHSRIVGPTTQIDAVRHGSDRFVGFGAGAAKTDTGWETWAVGTEFKASGAIPAPPENLTAADPAEASVDISWGPPAEGEPTFYRVYRDEEAVLDTTSASATVDGIPSGSAPTFTVRSGDNAGRLSEPSDAITIEMPSGTPPGAPSDLSVGTVTSSSVELEWSASTDAESGLAHYVVHVDGEARTTTESETTTVHGLQADRTYEFAVSAVDRGENESERTESATATTEPGADPVTEYRVRPVSEGTRLPDESGNGRHATVEGAEWIEDTSSPGEDDWVLELGDGDYVQAPTDHLEGADEFTQLLWVKLDHLDEDQTLAGDWGTPENTYVFWFPAGSDVPTLVIRTGLPIRYDVESRGVEFSVTTDEWLLVGWTFNRDTGIKTFANGVQIASADVVGHPIKEASPPDHQFGADFGVHPSLDGRIHSITEWTEEKHPDFVREYYEERV
jgi:hypothetical protein